MYENNQLLGLADPTLAEFDKNEATRLIRVTFLCTQASPMMQLPMSRVVAMLTSDIEISSYVKSKLFDRLEFQRHNS